jgi:hypothetical protein
LGTLDGRITWLEDDLNDRAWIERLTDDWRRSQPGTGPEWWTDWM